MKLWSAPGEGLVRGQGFFLTPMKLGVVRMTALWEFLAQQTFPAGFVMLAEETKESSTALPMTTPEGGFAYLDPLCQS